MANAGTLHGNFTGALRRRNLTSALAAARDLPAIGLGDALALTLLAYDAKQLELYSTMAAKWASRWITDQKADLAEATLVVGALNAIAGKDPKAGAFALLAVAKRRRETEVTRAIETWLRDAPPANLA